MTPQQLAYALDPGLLFQLIDMEADPWQRHFVANTDTYVLLNCSRGAGKTQSTAVKAADEILHKPGSFTLIVSRAQRQSLECFRYIKKLISAYYADEPIPAKKFTETQIELANGARVVCVPGKEENIRSYQGVTLLIIDEAARVPDELYYAVRPMVRVKQGRIIALSTPFGQRGWFYREWEDRKGPFKRYEVPWNQCPRIRPADIDNDRRSMGDTYVAQEYECSFASVHGVVYPGLDRLCGVDMLPIPIGPGLRRVGGIDFGYRNPFAAVWGWIDPKTDNLEIVAERYMRETALHEHAMALPKDVEWVADPSHPTEINELRRCGLCVRRGNNHIGAGIAAVRARIETRRVKIHRQGCPNLLAEADLYRYPEARELSYGAKPEIPVDANNHALSAFRYLVSRIDAGFIARWTHEQSMRRQSDDAPELDGSTIDADRPPELDRTDGPLVVTRAPSLADHWNHNASWESMN